MFLENEIAQIDWKQVLDTVVNWCTTTGLKLLIALVVMFFSFKIINFITKKIYKRIQKKNIDKTIVRVLYTGTRFVLKVVILVCLVGYVGIETASLSAVIASLGVGISLAVQGTLSNFAGGMIIIIMRPFKLGDYITSNGQEGTVEDIKLFYTHIVTNDNKVVYIPNGNLANNVIVNASVKETRRVDVIMSVAYDTNLEFAKNLIRSVCAKNELILQSPEPFIDINEFAASSIDLKVRVWCASSNYWSIYHYLLNEIKNVFDENNIEIPFNQLDVNLKK
ncbi:MAG: mechanosensitive ion channel [Erysipelotrichaceae bacterium]|nr:mechanosensitive ion channel [Erysipelotrichaceae bacterium]